MLGCVGPSSTGLVKLQGWRSLPGPALPWRRSQTWEVFLYLLGSGWLLSRALSQAMKVPFWGGGACPLLQGWEEVIGCLGRADGAGTGVRCMHHRPWVLGCVCVCPTFLGVCPMRDAEAPAMPISHFCQLSWAHPSSMWPGGCWSLWGGAALGQLLPTTCMLCVPSMLAPATG